MNNLKMKMMVQLPATLFLLLWHAGILSAQVPTFQDCLGAQPICLGTYVNGNVITGTGNYPNEINPTNSCLLTGERNDAWYIVTTGSSGNLAMSIVPVNPAHNYDWAVYNLTSAVCSDIFTNASLQVSCNYSNLPGTTGANGLAGAQNNPVIPVLAGQTYLINVSGFSSVQQAGYTIDLSASTASVIDNSSPSIASVTAMNCGASSMTVSFSERVLCNSVQAADFTLTGPGGPYTVSTVSSTACNLGAGYSRDFVLSFTPAIQIAGTYSLNLTGVVTDLCANNATVPQTFQVPISGVNINIQKVDVTCFGGNNGSATAVVSGPPGPYTYQWSPGGGSSASAQWLTAGTYTVTVTTTLGCSATNSVTINQPLTGLTATSTTTPANGCAANGTATVTVSNGQAPFIYSWWPSGGNAATATGLTAGGYMVTITDANQCVLNYFLNVGSASGPSIAITNSSNVSCFGGNDGSATVTVSNATPPFTYSWLPSGGSGAVATGLSAGNYTVDVVVAPGCTLSTGVVIVEPPTAVSVAVNTTQPRCGNNNGAISLSASGGTGAYTYQWSPNISTSASANNLAPGTYNVTVTDGNGCSKTNTIVLQPSSQPVPTLINHQNVSCFGLSDGATGVSVTGGLAPLTYSWSSGQSSATLNNIPAGTYTVTVSDAAGCTASVSDHITQPSEITISVQNILHVKCNGQLTGAASLISTGGSGNNVWTWSGNVSTSSSVSNVAAGNYNVTVSDQSGCSASTQVNITEPAQPLSVSGTVTPTTCGNNDGGVSTSVSGGTTPYAYQWGTGSSSSSLNNLNAGIYSVTITDNNSCTLTQDFTVQASNAPVVSSLINTNVSCFGGNNGASTLSVTGGVAPYTWQWQNGVSTTSSALNLTAGNYNVTVTDNSGCAAFYQVVISQPTAISAQIPVQSTICIGSSANIVPAVSGGVAPYTYLWNTGAITSQIIVAPVVNSAYTLTVSDANGCVINSQPVTVPVFTALNLTSNYPAVICKGQQALVSLVATGGDSNYNFAWSNGLSGSSNNILVNSDTIITIILSDGCTTPVSQTTVSIQAISSPDVQFNIANQAGCAPFEAKFEITAGLPSGLIFEWDFGDGFFSNQPSVNHIYPDAGIYQVKLKISYAAAPDCPTILNFTNAVNVYQVPTARFIFDPPSPTLSQPEIYFTNRSTGAVYSRWNFGDGNESSDVNPKYAYTDTGKFVVRLSIQSQEGCHDSTFNVVEVKDELQFFIPNAFTPNGSGVNDNFNVYGVGYVSYEMTIYDRWGKQIFYTKEGAESWDGKDQRTGLQVPQGMYVYKVTIIDNAGKVHNRVDHVTVIR